MSSQNTSVHAPSSIFGVLYKLDLEVGVAKQRLSCIQICEKQALWNNLKEIWV